MLVPEQIQAGNPRNLKCYKEFRPESPVEAALVWSTSLYVSSVDVYMYIYMYKCIYADSPRNVLVPEMFITFVKRLISELVCCCLCPIRKKTQGN